MKVIDMHTHIYPDKVARKAAIAIADYFALPEPPNHYGSVQELVDILDVANVDYAMISSAATTTHQVEPINRFIHEQSKKYPQFIPCGTLHTDYENYQSELRWLREHDIHGVKIVCEFQHLGLWPQRWK